MLEMLSESWSEISYVNHLNSDNEIVGWIIA